MSDNPPSSDKANGGSIEPIEAKLLEGLPKEHRPSALKAVSRYVQISHESYTSPIPPPSVLAQYDEILPGCADRILKMAESQERHRHNMESSVVRSNIMNERLGLFAALTLALILTLGSIGLIAINRPVEGLSIVLGETIVLVGSFYYAQHRLRQERKERLKELSDQPNKDLPSLSPPSHATSSGKQSKRSRRR
jgi:uncharacterized membrane protein